MQVRQSSAADLEIILPMMRAYYRDDGLEFVEVRARAALTRLLAEPQWGVVYLIELAAKPIGYIAICMGYSLELGGNDAIVDEMFVEPDFRGRGVATRALQIVLDDLALRDVRALHLEVDASNTTAQRMYAALGFEKRDRYYIMTKSI